MNDLVVGWCRAEGLEVTRSRAYRKNDQAWVEQKNGAIVRRLVGYGRLEGVLAGEILGRLYASARLHGNLFQPSFKLREKRREGSRVIKRYHAPEPPVVRALSTAVEFRSNVGVENSPLRFGLVSSVTAGRLDGGEIAEVKVDDGLEGVCRGGFAEAVG